MASGLEGVSPSWRRTSSMTARTSAEARWLISGLSIRPARTQRATSAAWYSKPLARCSQTRVSRRSPASRCAVVAREKLSAIRAVGAVGTGNAVAARELQPPVGAAAADGGQLVILERGDRAGETVGDLARSQDSPAKPHDPRSEHTRYPSPRTCVDVGIVGLGASGRSPPTW